MPTYLFSHLQAQYGAKSLVQEYTASIVITMRHYMSEDIRLQSFARFLSQARAPAAATLPAVSLRVTLMISINRTIFGCNVLRNGTRPCFTFSWTPPSA
jgi:hypothetical protein